MADMTITKTRKRVKSCGFGTVIDGEGWVMYGTNPQTGKWFERWFATEEAARTYAVKRHWSLKGETSIAEVV